MNMANCCPEATLPRLPPPKPPPDHVIAVSRQPEKGRQSKNTIEIGSLQNQLKSDVGSEGNETTLKHASYREGRNNDNRRNESDDSRGVEGNLKGEVGCVSLSADVYIHPTCQLSTQSWVRPRHMFRVLVLSDRVTYSQLSTTLR